MHGAVEQIPGASHETDGCMAVPNPVQSARELGLRCTTALLNFADNAGLHRSQLLAKMGALCRQYSENKSAPLCW